MSGRAFILIKASDSWPESVEQAEACLAILLKILWIGRAGTYTRSQVTVKDEWNRDFVRFLGDMANSPKMGRFVI